MRPHLLHRRRDLELERDLPPRASDVRADLELDAVVAAMADGDSFLSDVALRVLLAEPPDAETVRHRQGILQDGLAHPAAIREMYALAVEAVESRREHWWGMSSRHPSGLLHGAVSLLEALFGTLRKVRNLADDHAGDLTSAGLSRLVATLEAELSDDYLARVERELDRLSFGGGIELGARLGPGNEGVDYVLRAPREGGPGWKEWLFGGRPEGYAFEIDDEDLAGARILSDLRALGLYDAAVAVGRAARHVLGFFRALRGELGFYVGCINLRDALDAAGAPVCIPEAEERGSPTLAYRQLRDVSLALTRGAGVIGNDLEVARVRLGVVTGANEGGKSTFLRSLGLAHLMMGAGMFVAAESFRAGLPAGVFTHFAREEDAGMERGHFDEELARLSAIVDALEPGALILLNESFGSTNEREGSEIAAQVVRALHESGMRTFFVTHLYAFARHAFEDPPAGTLFLRAQREPDGTRTFRIVPGEPLETSFAQDVYREVFGGAAASATDG